MRCEQVTPYLPGYAGGDLRADTTRVVANHLASCRSCETQAAVQRRVIDGLGTLQLRSVEPPAYLLDSILENSTAQSRRLIPVLPIPAADLARAISDHRETIASAAGTALVAAGAAYAVWRAVKGGRATREQPAT